MRECDDAAMRRARVFVDTRAGATQEGGDIVQAMKAGVLTAEDIAGELLELTRGERRGRRYYEPITVFKSVGTALQDLAPAQIVCGRALRQCGFSSGLAAALKGSWIAGGQGTGKGG